MSTENNVDGPYRIYPQHVTSLLDIATQALNNNRDAAEALIARGGAWINRERVRVATAMVLPGMMVTIHTLPSYAHPCQLTSAAIIYQDRWLLAINKPVGSYVDATPWDGDNHLRTELARLLAESDQHPPLHPAHRLDRDTTGVLLFTQHPHANAALQKIFVNHLAQKYYLCHVYGHPDWDTCDTDTGHGRSERGRFRIYPRDTVGDALPNGDTIKQMRTTFHVIQRLVDGTSIIKAIPHTGRTHQIRLHIAELGHAIVGDRSYGSATEAVQPHRLHAWQLTFPHPIHDTPITIIAPLPAWLPDDLAQTLATTTTRGTN
jgi:23S rRNA pseudouridine1911/1915/1917 synthase